MFCSKLQKPGLYKTILMPYPCRRLFKKPCERLFKKPCKALQHKSSPFLSQACFRLLLPCKSPKADPGLAIPSPAANFLKLVSLELGRGLDADEKAPPPRPVNPSKLDCLVLAKALKIYKVVLFCCWVFSSLFMPMFFAGKI